MPEDQAMPVPAEVQRTGREVAAVRVMDAGFSQAPEWITSITSPQDAAPQRADDGGRSGGRPFPVKAAGGVSRSQAAWRPPQTRDRSVDRELVDVHIDAGVRRPGRAARGQRTVRVA